MAENSKIEWTTHTFNPWMGCTKVSPACKHCYAERDMDKRLGKVAWGPNGTRVVTGEANWQNPVKWNRLAGELPTSIVKPYSNPIESIPVPRPRVFCASLADVFEDWAGPMHTGSLGEVLAKPYLDSESGPENWNASWPDDMQNDPQGWRYVTMDDVRRRLFNLIDATPHLDWLLLTKRPENIRRMWPEESDGAGGRLANAIFGRPGKLVRRRDNVWLGTSVENQEQADKRIPELLKCRDLSPVLFLSCEPLLGAVDLRNVQIAKNDCYAGPDAIADDLFDSLSGETCSGETGCVVSDDGPSINWVIAGGESGPNARPSHPDWFRSLRDQCQTAGVAFHFKQWGEWAEHAPEHRGKFADRFGALHVDGSWSPTATPFTSDEGRATEAAMVRVGKKNAGRTLDDCLHDGIPQVTTGVV